MLTKKLPACGLPESLRYEKNEKAQSITLFCTRNCRVEKVRQQLTQKDAALLHSGRMQQCSFHYNYSIDHHHCVCDFFPLFNRIAEKYANLSVSCCLLHFFIPGICTMSDHLRLLPRLLQDARMVRIY